MPRLSISPASEPATPPAADAAPARIAVIGEGVIAPIGSPARALHDRLVASFVDASMPAEPSGLSARLKLAILLGSCALLWSAIAFAVAVAIG